MDRDKSGKFLKSDEEQEDDSAPEKKKKKHKKRAKQESKPAVAVRENKPVVLTRSWPQQEPFKDLPSGGLPKGNRFGKEI